MPVLTADRQVEKLLAEILADMRKEGATLAAWPSRPPISENWRARCRRRH